MIETATRTDASLIVLSGLKAGDTVITSGIMSLKNDAPVK
jgi:membrane fusion protein (multidrug efflux system)